MNHFTVYLISYFSYLLCVNPDEFHAGVPCTAWSHTHDVKFSNFIMELPIATDPAQTPDKYNKDEAGS